MNIKDIVNRDLVNLTNCEHEPIHIPGSIQPHGCLIAFRDKEFSVEFCSDNCFDFLGLSPRQILGSSISDILGNDLLNDLKNYLNNNSSEANTLFNFQINNSTFNCTIHKSSDIYILEAERVNNNKIEVTELFNQTRRFVGYMEQSLTLKALASRVADETRQITGYDRVMIYRFDKDYNGEVFAESKRDDVEPFLGLHYPHTDIPQQARILYLKNLVRLISDINYTPVPVLTINDASNKDLDLSLSVLRSTSPIHVQYLSNMGVGATLTISLIHENKLWGLIACHHYSPKYVSPDVRLSAQLQGHFLTSQIDVRQSAEEYETARDINSSVENLLDLKLEMNSDSLQQIVDHSNILGVCNASGVSISHNGKVYTRGITPPEQELKKLLNWCDTYSGSKGYFHTDKLNEIYSDTASLCDSAAGVIYHSMGNNSNSSIVWFRPETIHEINWAGDPAKATVKDVGGLHPRKSFSLWKEVVKCQSRPWIQPELNGAATYAHAFQKHIHLLQLTEEEIRYKQLNEVLQETNAELENINWISTHDLQEPLRKIQIMASRIIDIEAENVPVEITHSVKRMNASAARMQTLLKDILSYARIKHSDHKAEPVDLTSLLNQLTRDMHDELNDKNVTVNIDKLPSIQGTPFLLNQLMLNLIRNSIKFSKQGQNSVINIYSEADKIIEEGSFTHIVLSDNGIGFENEFADSIFKLFTKLHNSSEYSGSGVGLALCKKIMQSHSGFITAEGEIGEGAKFNLYFPNA